MLRHRFLGQDESKLDFIERRFRNIRSDLWQPEIASEAISAAEIPFPSESLCSSDAGGARRKRVNEPSASSFDACCIRTGSEQSVLTNNLSVRESLVV